MKNRAGIISIGTAVPERVLTQASVGEAVLKALPDTLDIESRRIRQLGKRLYRSGGIDTRHTVLPSFPDAGPEGRFIPDGQTEFDGPSTGERNEIYRREIGPLALMAAKKALVEADDPSGARVTHLITASCTGFSAPGFEIDLIGTLGLKSNVARMHLGFMGCYAALPALRAAKAFALQSPEAVVLVVCAELCSLHYRHCFSPDALMANSIFGDGAAAAIVTASHKNTQPCLFLDTFRSQLGENTADAMQWTIGNHGFIMELSQTVPRRIGAWLPSLVNECCLASGITPRDIAHFAIHPGGRTILDHAAKALDGDKEALWASYEILQHYGNMSSPTILFVLERIMKTKPRGPLFAAAFGPGLCAETAMMEAL